MKTSVGYLQVQFCKRSVFYVPFSFIEIQVKYVMDGIMLVCPEESQIIKDDRIYNNSLKLEYKDESSGEYICQDEKNTKIFVKIRSKFCFVLCPLTRAHF